MNRWITLEWLKIMGIEIVRLHYNTNINVIMPNKSTINSLMG